MKQKKITTLKNLFIFLFIYQFILISFARAEKYETQLFSETLESITTRSGGKIGEISIGSSMLFLDKNSLDFFIDNLNKIPPDNNITRGAVSKNIYSQYSNSVVLILNAKSRSTGSGSVIDKEARIILTNWHVVNKAKEVGVIFKNDDVNNKRNIRLAEVLSYDATRDLALIKLKEKIPEIIKSISINKEPLSVGEDVHAIGHPSSLSWTYTKGYVSQIRKKFKWKYTSTEHQANIVQTQTPISPGSSGGPLLTNDGMLAGINSFGRQDAQNLNFAISSDEILDFLYGFKSGKFREAKSINNLKDKKVKKIVKKIDTNKDGKIDTYLVDENGDGKIDMVIKDKNGNGIPESVGIDTDKNGKIDLVIFDKNEDGKPDLWLIDKNNDGKPDIAGYDTDGDRKPDKFRKISQK